MIKINFYSSFIIYLFLSSFMVRADENLLGYVKGAETLPQNSFETYEILTARTQKGAGHYLGIDSKTNIEYGWTDRLTIDASLKMLAIEAHDLLIDAYLPQDKKLSLTPSGTEWALKYNFLSPAKDDFGLSSYLSLSYDWLDIHSGQDKDKVSLELLFLMQKYFLEGELIWVANLGTESAHSDRKPISHLPDNFEWPVEPEMEIEFKAGTGLSYRFIPNWFIGGEAMYEVEYETEVNCERWSLFAGPSLHYGSEKWWSTITWMPQLKGGGLTFPEQDTQNLHLIEKTKQEFRWKIGFDF